MYTNIKILYADARKSYCFISADNGRFSLFRTCIHVIDGHKSFGLERRIPKVEQLKVILGSYEDKDEFKLAAASAIAASPINIW